MKKQTGYILCVFGVLAFLGAIELLLLSVVGFGMDIESRVICAGLALVVFEGGYAACRKGRSLIAGEKRKDTFPADWAFAEKSKCEGAAEHKEEPVAKMPVSSSADQSEENDIAFAIEDQLPVEGWITPKEYDAFEKNKAQLFSLEGWHMPQGDCFGGRYIYVDMTTGQLYLLTIEQMTVCRKELPNYLSRFSLRTISYEEMLALADEKEPGIAEDNAGINETNWREYTKCGPFYLLRKKKERRSVETNTVPLQDNLKVAGYSTKDLKKVQQEERKTVTVERITPSKKQYEKNKTQREFENRMPFDEWITAKEFYDFIQNKTELLFLKHTFFAKTNSFFGKYVYVDNATGELYLISIHGSTMPTDPEHRPDYKSRVSLRAIDYSELISLVWKEYSDIATEYRGINETNWREYANVQHDYARRVENLEEDILLYLSSDGTCMMGERTVSTKYNARARVVEYVEDWFSEGHQWKGVEKSIKVPTWIKTKKELKSFVRDHSDFKVDMTSDYEDPQDRIRQWFSYEMLDNGIDTEKQKEITSNLYIYHSKANGYKLVRDGDLVLFQTEDEDTFLDKLAEVAKKLKDFPPRSWKGSKLVRTLKNENGKSVCIVRNETHSFVMIEESYTLDKGLRTAADCNNCRVYCVPTSQIDEITAENWWKFAAVVPTYKSFNASPGQGAR